MAYTDKQLENLRRRGRYLMQKLQAEIDSGAYNEAAIYDKRMEMSYIQEEIEYTKKRGNDYQTRQHAGAALEARSLSETELSRKNIQAAYEINNTYYVSKDEKIEVEGAESYKHEQNPASRYTESQMRFFYKVTQAAWDRKGVDPNAKIEAVMDFFEVDDLEMFIDVVLQYGDKSKWDKVGNGVIISSKELVGADEKTEYYKKGVEQTLTTRDEIETLKRMYREIHIEEYGDI